MGQTAFTKAMIVTPVSVSNGGTGVSTLAANGVLIGNSTSTVHVTATGTAGQVLTSNGTGLDPTFQSFPSGVPGGINGYFQYNDSGNFGGLPTFTTDGTDMFVVGGGILKGLDGSANVTTRFLDGEISTFDALGTTGLSFLTANNASSNKILYTATGGSLSLITASLSSTRTQTFQNASGTVALTSDLTGFITSVTGTSNRITSTGGVTPVIDISSSYVGQASITTLGTITTGTWTGTTIAIANGGTGQTSAANAINALVPSQTGNGGKFLTTDGSVVSWASASGGVASVSNSDGTLTISPTTGAVVASINLTHANTWIGVQTFSPVARTSGIASYFTINAPADTGITTATESIGINHVGAIRTWVDGTVAIQREYLFQAPTYNKTTTAATFTQSGTVVITGAPNSGTGVTQTNPYSLWVQGGTVHVGAQLGGTPFAAISGTGIEVFDSNNTTGGQGVVVNNTSTGIHAYSSYTLANDLANGSTYTHYAGMFLNGSNWNDATFGTAFNVANQLSFYGTDGPTIIGTLATGGAAYMNIVIGGATTADEIARFTTTGMGIGTTTVTSKLNVNATNLGTTQTLVSGITVGTNTAAVLNGQQISGAIRWQGFGWATASSTSRDVTFVSYVIPTQGNANPTAQWVLQASINGAALGGNLLSVTQGGTTATGSSLSVGGSGSFICTGNVSLGTTVNNNTIGIGDGSTSSGNTTTINIGTVGVSGAIKAITIGSSVSGVTSTTTINGTTTFVGKATFIASTTSAASFNIPGGTAPTSPTNGDVWYDSSHLYGRVNGITAQLDNATTETIVSGTVSTTNATITTIATIVVPATTTLSIEVTVVARRTGGASGTAEDGGRIKLQGVYKNVAGTATIVGSLLASPSDFNQAWTATITASSGNILVQVTGAASNNINWIMSGRTISIS